MSNTASLVLNDSNIPQLPDRREDFISYEWKMKAYLDARGLLSFIEHQSSGNTVNGKDVVDSSSSSPVVMLRAKFNIFER